MKRISIFNLARQNIKRRMFRNLMIIGSVILAIGTLFTASMLLRGVETGIREGANSLGADLMVMPQSVEGNVKALLTGEAESMLMGGVNTGDFMDISLMEKVATVEGVEQVTPQLYMATWDEGGACCRLANVNIIGFDPKSDFIVQRLIENKYDVKKPFPHDEIFLGYNLTVEMEDYEVIRKWQVYGYNFKAIGRLKKTGTALDWSMFIPMEGCYMMVQKAAENATPGAAERIRQINRGMVSAFLTKVDQLTVKPKEIGLDIKRAVPDMSVVATAEMVTRLQRQLHGTVKTLVYSGLIVWIMSVLVVGAIFSVVVNERKREIGLLRAIGFRRSSVFKLIIYESTLLTSLGGFLGLLAGIVIISSLDQFLQESMKMPFTWPSSYFFGVLTVICLLAGLASGLFGGLYPAARCSIMEPMAAIRTGE
jgi:putative ABC transport system permease protein